MIEILSVCFCVTLFSASILAVLLDNAKKDMLFLQRVNNTLADENHKLADKNKLLLEKVESISTINEEQKAEIRDILESLDIHEYPVGAKISWVDKNGDLEIGEIIDDSKVDGKTFVHVRRINKKGNFVGGVISLPSNKIKLEN